MLESVLQIFPVPIREQTSIAVKEISGLEEIRIRIERPVEFRAGDEVWYLRRLESSEREKQQKETRRAVTKEPEAAYRITETDMQELVTFLSRYSPYAFTEEIRNGYITLEGGHRVGIAGQARMEGELVADISYIRFLNIRIARERKGCAKDLLTYLKRGDSIYNTLLLSAPGVGKSTLLRDCIRLLSDGGLRVSLVDERSEIAACHMGIPQNDVGRCTDVLDRCKKPAGMRMMLRAMAPQILAVDELGCGEDFAAVEQALNCGCRILGTVHAGDLTELTGKSMMKHWVESGVFERYVLLRRDAGGNRSYAVYNGELEQLC